MRSIFLLLVGVLCCSTSVLFIKASGLHPAVLASYRLLAAALLLSPVYFAQVKKHRASYSVRHLKMTLLPALTLALHFISWAQGAQLTRAANASLIGNMNAVVIPFLLFFLMRERVSPREIVGTLIALVGVLWLASSDLGVTSTGLWGDIVCFGSMLLFSFYLVQGRLNRDIPNIWLYLVPLYAFAGLICLVVATFVAEPFAPHPPRALACALGLTLMPTIIGHSILNMSIQRLNGQIVSVCNLFQFLFAGALAFLLFHEAPHPAFYGAGLLVVTGAVLVIYSSTVASKRAEASTLPESAT
ncbi:DMT family transporter [bacterium]|nr:MAG: DMT family transporter [bacterium]